MHASESHPSLCIPITYSSTCYPPAFVAAESCLQPFSSSHCLSRLRPLPTSLVSFVMLSVANFREGCLVAFLTLCFGCLVLFEECVWQTRKRLSRLTSSWPCCTMSTSFFGQLIFIVHGSLLPIHITSVFYIKSHFTIRLNMLESENDVQCLTPQH